MLAGLARRLRAAGHDVTLPRQSEEDVSVSATAVREGRVLVTRDRGLAALAPGAVLLGDGTTDEAARELSRALPVDWLEAPFTRCVLDNAVLKPAGAADLERVPEPMKKEGPHRVCPECGRVFWSGSHVRRMRAELERLARESPQPRCSTGT